MRLIGLALVLISSARAQTDPQLAAVHRALQSLQSQADVSAVNPGAGPTLTLVKHLLRDWIESQLGPIQKEGDQTKAAGRMNQLLERISPAPKKDNQSLLGSLGNVSLEWEAGLLIVTTSVGIVCATDDSAYAYKRIGGQWHRIWESEQNDDQLYTPQHISAVQVWQSYESGAPAGPAYILTLGNEWGCASNWHRVYYRIWRVNASASKLLVDQHGDAYLRGQSYILGSIVNSPMHFGGPVDAIIEFTQGSVDAGVHNREAVRHFLIDGDQVRRVSPVALSPRDFVDEWMTQPWSESRGWSLSPDLARWHQELHGDFVGGKFLGVTMRCETPDLWQVGFEPHDPTRNFKPRPGVYFLVRWTPPYRFALSDIGNTPRPQCAQPDPEADAWRTLFSTQEWRW